MLHYNIISLDENEIECNDEIVSSIELTFSIGQVLEKSHYFGKRTIIRIVKEPI